MSFTAYFSYQANLKPTWKKYYISYPELKNALHHIRDEMRQMKEEQKAARKRAKMNVPIVAVEEHHENADNETVGLLTQKVQPSLSQAPSTASSISRMGQALQNTFQMIVPAQDESKDDFENVDEEGDHRVIMDDYFYRIEIGESLNSDIENFKNMFKKDVETIFKKYTNEIKRINERIARNQKDLIEAKMRPFFNSETGPILQEKFVAIYRELEFLSSFLHVNRIASNNLLQKFEFCGEHSKELANWYNTLPNADYNTTDLKLSMESVEQLFTKYFTFSDQSKALSALRQPSTNHSQGDAFKLALCIGMVVPLFFIIVAIWFFKDPYYDQMPGFFDVLPIYRATMLYIMYGWLYGLNLFVWERFKVNFAYLFEFDPVNHLKSIKIWKTTSVLTVFWFLFFFLYMITVKGYLTILDAKWYPLTMGLILIFISILPMHLVHLSARYTLLKVLAKLLITPFGNIRFREFFVADVLTSMVIPITDTAYMLCYYFSNSWNGDDNKCHDFNKFLGPCLTFLPFLWRMLQCCRRFYDDRTQKSQLLNALKYVAALSVIFFNTLHVNLEDNDSWGPFRYIWIVVTPISTFYAFSWDILMDWGLFKFKKVKEEKRPQRKLEAFKRFFTEQYMFGYKIVMRDRRLYGRKKLIYRLAIVFNLFARFAWAGTISTYFKENKEYLAILFGSIEMIRRCNWSVFRLEWAAISNDEGWRKHNFVPGMDFEKDNSKKN